MVIDPVCSLVFEAETDEEDVMRRKPRAPDEPLFSWPLIGWSVLQGGLAFGLVGAIFVIAHQRGMPEDEVRALTFFSLVLSIVSLILVNRSFSTSLVAAFRRPNPALRWILLAVTTILGLSLRLARRECAVPVRAAACRRSSIDARRWHGCAESSLKRSSICGVPVWVCESSLA